MSPMPASGTKNPRMPWAVISLIPFLHWLPMVIAGVNARYHRWWMWGLLYFLPVFMVFVLIDPEDSGNAGIVKEDSLWENLIFMAFFATYFASIYHIFSIRKTYKKLMQGIAPDSSRQSGTMPGAYSPQKEARALSKSIMRKIKRSRHFDTGILDDTQPLVDKWLEQLKELENRDKQLRSVLADNKAELIKKQMWDMERKMHATKDPELKQEYSKTINQYLEQLETLQDFKKQREKIQLRMKHTLSSLRQLKFNLMKMEQLSAEQQRKEVYKAFDEKVKDLSDYLQALDSTLNANY